MKCCEKNKKNYQNGFIYKICSLDKNLSLNYIGSSTNFKKRESYHKNDCNNPNSKNYNLKIYQIIRDNGGWDMFEILVIEKFPCSTREELNKREEEFRVEYDANMNTKRCWTGGVRLRCSIEGCDKGRKFSTNLCVSHGAISKTCITEGCTSNSIKDQLCFKHRLNKDEKSKLPCIIEGCKSQRSKDQLCFTHRLNKDEKSKVKDPCTVEGCTLKQINGGLCYNHGAKKLLCIIEGCTSGRRKDKLCYKHRLK